MVLDSRSEENSEKPEVENAKDKRMSRGWELVYFLSNEARLSTLAIFRHVDNLDEI